MIHTIKCLQDHHHNDLIKNYQNYGGFQEVLFFVQKRTGNIRDSDWYFQLRHFKGIMDHGSYDEIDIHSGD